MTVASDKSRGNYFLSAIMIALSFLAMIIPLAMYHVAQIAAASGLRKALMVLIGVVGLLSFFGVITGQQLLLFSGISALAWFPAFAVSLQARIRGGRASLFVSALVMLIVPALMLLTILSPAPVSDFELFLREGLQGMMEAARLTGAPQAIQNAEQLDATLQSMKASPEFLTLRSLFENPWDARLLWLVFGSGSPWLFGILLMALGNLVLLDLAFEQVEKLRTVTRYILDFPTRFSEHANATARAMEDTFHAPLEQRFSVQAVRRLDDGTGASQSTPVQTQGSNQVSTPLRYLIKPARDSGSLVFMGYRFSFKRFGVGTESGFLPASTHPQTPHRPSWRLKDWRLPLPYTLGCAATLIGVGFSQTRIGELGRIVALDQAVQTPPIVLPEPVLAIVGAAAFFGSTLLALEGMLVALSRLTPLALLILLLFALFAGTMVAANPLLVIAVLGAVGLLDHLYDFRKLRPNTKNPG